MADFVYNPAESIKQSFQQAGAGIGNIFTQVIAQQQRDYNLAESAFQNIEALKKDVNIFGQKTITSKSNDLLKQAGSAILKDGKLDYSKLGEIRQSISDIKDLKTGYDVGAKEYERMLQLGIANKDNLVSFEKFYKDLSSKMADENLVKNPQDLQKAMADTYTNNLDSFKMFGKSYLGANPYQKIAQDIKDPKTGALMRVQAELPAGWTIDAQGNRVPLPPKTVVVNGQTVTMDYVDQELARLKSTNPEMLELMKKQAGFAGQTISERDLVKAAIDRVPTTVQASQLKSKEELKIQENTAKASELSYATAQAGLTGQRLANEGRRLQNEGQRIENQTNEFALNSLTGQSQQASDNEIYFPSAKSMIMPIGDKNIDVSGKAQKLTFDPKTGKMYVSALKSASSGFNIGETQNDIKEVAQVEIPKNKLASFKKSVLASTLSGVEAKQKPIVRKQVEDMFKRASEFNPNALNLSNNLLPKLTLPKSVNKAKAAVSLSEIKNNMDRLPFGSVDEAVNWYINNQTQVVRN